MDKAPNSGGIGPVRCWSRDSDQPGWTGRPTPAGSAPSGCSRREQAPEVGQGAQLGRDRPVKLLESRARLLRLDKAPTRAGPAPSGCWSRDSDVWTRPAPSVVDAVPVIERFIGAPIRAVGQLFPLVASYSAISAARSLGFSSGRPGTGAKPHPATQRPTPRDRRVAPSRAPPRPA